MPRAHALLFAFVMPALLAACETTTTKTVGPDDGGAPPAQDAPPTDPAVLSSPHRARCKVACAAPDDGPCATGQDVAACVTKCTTALDGFSATCAQCIVEHSGWAGEKCPDTCDPTCPPCEIPFGPEQPAKQPCDGADPGGGAPPPTPTCTPSCKGFVLARTSAWTCAPVCEP